MTAPQRDGEFKTPFHKWLRQEAGLDAQRYQLSITDNDFWIHKFSSRADRRLLLKPTLELVQLIEVKTFAADMPFAQKDTLEVIDRILRKATVVKDRRRPVKIADGRNGRANCFRSVRWYGLH